MSPHSMYSSDNSLDICFNYRRMTYANLISISLILQLCIQHLNYVSGSILSGGGRRVNKKENTLAPLDLKSRCNIQERIRKQII